MNGMDKRHYFYTDKWQIIEEVLEPSVAPAQQFVWGLLSLDNLICRDKSTSRLYAVGDYYSCTGVVDTTGAVQERYGYDAFGQPWFMGSAFSALAGSAYAWETLYDSYRWDKESGLYQVRYRYLHPTLGRWITSDQLCDPAFALSDAGNAIRILVSDLSNLLTYTDFNLYAFALNNSVNLTDIIGLTCTDPCGQAKNGFG